MPKVDPKQEALAAIEGLEFSDVFRFFNDKATDRDKAIADMVATDDELEVDGAITSEGGDNGSWVLAWTWVDFNGTPFTKICQCCGNDTDKVVPVETDIGETEYVCEECSKEMADA